MRSRRTQGLKNTLSVVDSTADSTAVIFVNGIRTLASGAFQGERDLQLMIDTTASLSGTFATHYWNRNLRGEILAFADQHLGCAGRAVRDGGIRHRLTSLVRYAFCKGLSIVTIPILDDIGSSALEFTNLQWGLTTPQSGDVDRLAELVAEYHGRHQHTISVTHSEGNMIFKQAVPKIAQLDSVNHTLSYCTSALSLAAPIDTSAFGMSDDALRGMTIRGDLLLVLGLPNTFPPPGHYRSAASDAADTAISGAPALLVPFLKVKWGVSIHDVNSNYFRGVRAETTNGFLQALYSFCPHT